METSFWLAISVALFVVLVPLIFWLRRRRTHKMDETDLKDAWLAGRLNYSAHHELAGSPIDNDVQFTVFRPATVVPEKWYPLLAFAHLSKKRAEAEDEQPDPIEEVRRQASLILNQQPAKYESAKLDRGFSVPRKRMLTFMPVIPGCEFNPPSQGVIWQKDIHKLEFEMRAFRAVDGSAVEGQMVVFLGSLILAEVPLRIDVESHYLPEPDERVVEQARPYRKIFASYSHSDTAMVKRFEEVVYALGDLYLRDVTTLRSGEVWSEQLEQMIREANIFQLLIALVPVGVEPFGVAITPNGNFVYVAMFGPLPVKALSRHRASGESAMCRAL